MHTNEMTHAYSGVNFAAGLEQFGTLAGRSWAEELEELASTAPAAAVHMDTSVPVDEGIDGTLLTDPFLLEGYFGEPGPVIVHTSPSPPPVHDAGRVGHVRAASRIAHPGWSEETPSPHDSTASSPELCRWVVSPGIFQGLKMTLDMCKDSNFVHRDVARAASCLSRAIQHVYQVPGVENVGFPFKAMGKKVILDRLPRGSKGLKEPYDLDIPKDIYVPNGIKVRMPIAHGKNFYPRPSNLRHVTNADELEITEPAQLSQDEKCGDSYKIHFRHISQGQGAQHSNLRPVTWNSNPAMTPMSGEKLPEVIDTASIPASDYDDEVLIQPFGHAESDQDHESDRDDYEDPESFFDEKIEASFNVEINGGSLLSDVVDDDDDDDDDEYYYGSSDDSSFLDPLALPHLDRYSPTTMPDFDDVPAVKAKPRSLKLDRMPRSKTFINPFEPDKSSRSRIPGLESTHKLDLTLLTFELPGMDDSDSEVDEHDIDEEISKLDSMSVESLEFDGDEFGLYEFDTNELDAYEIDADADELNFGEPAGDLNPEGRHSDESNTGELDLEEHNPNEVNTNEPSTEELDADKLHDDELDAGELNAGEPVPAVKNTSEDNKQGTDGHDLGEHKTDGHSPAKEASKEVEGIVEPVDNASTTGAATLRPDADIDANANSLPNAELRCDSSDATNKDMATKPSPGAHKGPDGITGVVAAVVSVVWELCSANPLSVFLF